MQKVIGTLLTLFFAFFIILLSHTVESPPVSNVSKPGHSATTEPELGKDYDEQKGKINSLFLRRENLATETPDSVVAPTKVTARSVGSSMIPLTDLGTDVYLDQYEGGLYPEGLNIAPAHHDLEGRARAKFVQPIDGKVVMISVGMSNTNQEFCAFSSSPSPVACNSWSAVGQFESNKFVNHTTLAFVNCARGGQAAGFWTDVASKNYEICDSRIELLGHAVNQVQIAWVKVANPLAPLHGTPMHGATPRLSLPDVNADAYLLEQELGQIVRALKTRYPNLQQVFFSSRIYGGYSVNGGINPEPFAYEGGLAVKWLVQAQIDQVKKGRIIDARAGDLHYRSTPWIGWGPYLWADGANPRKVALPWDPSGVLWLKSDMESDFTHPSDRGEEKVGLQLLRYFLGSPYSAPWFSANGRQMTPEGVAI